MESIINYKLKAELHTRKDGEKAQSHLFERKFRFKYIEKDEQKAIVYDPELKMHFENQNAIKYVYEIEANNTVFELSGKLAKASDFIRRLNYRYDRVQLKVNRLGKISSIKNEDELKQNWKKLKSSLQANYQGEVADIYLEEIESRMNDSNLLHSDIQRYFNFGLIFPSIPYRHGNDWQSKRLVEFSEYEGEKFEEQIIFQKEEDNSRFYEVKIQSAENNNFELKQYEGNLIIPCDNVFPASALVEVVLRQENLATQWYFELKQEKSKLK